MTTEDCIENLSAFQLARMLNEIGDAAFTDMDLTYRQVCAVGEVIDDSIQAIITASRTVSL